MLDTTIAAQMRAWERECRENGFEITPATEALARNFFLAKYVRELKAQVALLRDALAFYTQDDLYREDTFYSALSDGGTVAETALERLDERQRKFLNGEG